MPVANSNATEFSKAPEGQAALSIADIKAQLNDKLHKAAKILGGTVDGVAPQGPDVDNEAVENKPSADGLIPVEDRKRYIRSLLAGEPFTKDYSLFGGVLTVTFCTRTTANAEELGKIEDLQSRFDRKLKMSLVAMVKAGKPIHVNTFGELDDISRPAVIQAFKDFEELCDVLFRRANDADFWIGTAGRI